MTAHGAAVSASSPLVTLDSATQDSEADATSVACRRSGRFRTVARLELSSRCTSAIQIVRPLESIAATQPQLQPALLSLSAMTSQCIAADGCRCFFFDNDDANSIPSAIASLTVPSRCLKHLAMTERHSASRGMSRSGCSGACQRSVPSYDDGAADSTAGLAGNKVRALVRGEAASSASVPARSADNGPGIHMAKIAVGA